MIYKSLDNTIVWIEELHSAQFFETTGYNFLLPQTPVKKLPTRFTLPFIVNAYSTYLQFSNKMPAFDFKYNGKLYHVLENESYLKHLNSSLISNSCFVDLYLDRFLSDGFDLKDKHFHRYITPITSNQIWIGFECLPYTENRVSRNFQLMSLTLAEGEVHIGITERKNDNDKQKYFFIEPQFECTAHYLGHIISFPIILALGLMQGDVHLNESYVFQYDDIAMGTPVAVGHRSLCESYHYEYHLVDYNAYPYLTFVLDRYKGKGKDRWLNDKIHEIASKYNNFVPASVMNNLVNMMIKYENVLRATHIMMTSISATLEMQPATCAVAMETLSGHVMKQYNLKAPNQVDSVHWDALKKVLLAKVAEAVQAGNLTAEEQSFVEKKINNLNQPANADKLQLPYNYFNYKVTQEEYNQAINNRNVLLHGSIGISMADIRKASDKLLADTLLFHRLCGVLLLKMAGYDGLIINYLKVYGKKSRRKLFISLK